MKSRVRITLLALAGLLSLGTCAFLRNTGSVYVNLGSVELSKAKSQPGDHLTRARSYFERSVELAPSDARGWSGLGKVASTGEELHEAAGFFSQALDFEPANGMLHLLLGNVYSALGRRSEAVGHWRETGRAQAIALNLYRSANEAIRDGQDRSAQALLLDAVALDPTLVDGYLALGNLYVKTDIARAIWAFESAAKIELASPLQISYAEGRAYVLKEDWASAVAALQRTVILDPDYAAAYYPLGYALYRQGESALAMQALQEAIILTPDHFYAHLLLGQVCLEQGNATEALSLFYWASILSPDDAQAHAWLGRTYREQGRLEEAAAELRKAIELEPANPQWHLDLADVYRDNAQWDLALGEYELALDLDPTNSRARMVHFQLGNVYSALGRRSEAVDHWLQTGRAQAIARDLYKSANEAIRDGQDRQGEGLLLDAVALDPTLVDSYLALGNLYLKTDASQAIWAFERAAKIESASPLEISYAKGRASVLKEDWGAAIEALQTTVSLDPGYGPAYYPLGYALYRQGEYVLAREALQEAIILTPDHFYAHLVLGRVYLAQGDAAEALSLFHRASILRPDDAQAHAWLGRTYLAQERLEEAATELRKAIELEPDNPEWHLHLARVYRDNGQWQLAVSEYEMVLDLDPTNSRAQGEIAALRRHGP